MPGQELGSQTVLAEAPPARRVEFVQKLETTRQEMHRYLLVRCLMRLGLMLLAGAGVIGLADWLMVLGPNVRAAALGMLVLGSLVLFYRWAIAPRREFGKQDAAGEVETTFPDLGQRVRTALEYAEPTPETAPALPTLVDALTTETDQCTGSLNLHQVIPWRSLAWAGGGLAALVVVFLWLIAAESEARVAAGRVLLFPIQYTQLAVESGDQTLKAGEDLTIQATLTGRPVRTADVL